MIDVANGMSQAQVNGTSLHNYANATVLANLVALLSTAVSRRPQDRDAHPGERKRMEVHPGPANFLGRLLSRRGELVRLRRRYRRSQTVTAERDCRRGRGQRRGRWLRGFPTIREGHCSRQVCQSIMLCAKTLEELRCRHRSADSSPCYRQDETG